MGMSNRFIADFRALNKFGAAEGPPPLTWQTRLFSRLCANDVPKTCELPTGMGKTSVIHLWTLALRKQIDEGMPRLPMRLVYVVDRRTVVDQATTAAERIRRNLPEIGLEEQWLSVSTLRGQFADNRDWTADPSRPAIIIGTVDMIGSRLLFSGYRSSFKLRPLDAGMLGQDTLLVLDEAHLSQAFEKLIHALSDEGPIQAHQGTPMRVMCMSATTKNDGADRFTLEPVDLDGDPEDNPVVRRYEAQKRLVLESPLEKGKIRDSIVKAAVDFAKGGARVVVFVQKPDDAEKIYEVIKKRIPESYVAVLTGTMRGLERDELLEKPVLQRFLNGNEKPEDQAGSNSVILVSTSAGEVGFDLNADHMVCDAAPLDSMIQRLGRVNRRGYSVASIRVFSAKGGDRPVKAKSTTPLDRKTWATAAVGALNCLEQLPQNTNGSLDASPKAIDRLRQVLPREEWLRASSPAPETIELTDILLDAWSMTTITGPMPGRPPVAPWLRGVNDDQPQTTLAWRAELDIPGFGDLEITDLEEWFDAHRVLPHETVTVSTAQASEWIPGRWRQLTAELQVTVGNAPCIVDRSGLQVLKIRELIDALDAKRIDAVLNGDIILPASFGGIERGKGWLADTAPTPNALTVASDERALHIGSDVADEGEAERYRELRTIADGIPAVVPLLQEPFHDSRSSAQFTLELPNNGDTIRQLISFAPKRQRPEYGNDGQQLDVHVGLVERYAGEISERLSIIGDIFRESLYLAAACHDNGKARAIWQSAANQRTGEGPLGKSRGPLRRIRGAYRHEFGSLREFADQRRGKISEDIFDLSMHLIAAHHGRGRPHFPKGGFDPNARDVSAAIATDAVRRFARLQRRYGYWQLAWLENLLRCADALASNHKDPAP